MSCLLWYPTNKAINFTFVFAGKVITSVTSMNSCIDKDVLSDGDLGTNDAQFRTDRLKCLIVMEWEREINSTV